MTALRTATELQTADLTDDQIMPIVKTAVGSGLFRVTLASLKAYFASGGGSGLPAGGAQGQVLTKKSATDGDADWETPSTGGGGGGGGGSILAFGWSNTNKDYGTATGGDVPVDSMTATFTLDAPAVVMVMFAAQLFRGGGGQARCSLYLDGVTALPSSDGSKGLKWYSIISTTENSFYSLNGSTYLSLPAGNHTIELRYSDAQAASATTFYQRHLTVFGTA